MTEQNMSIVDIEEAQAPEQARVRAAMALQRAGHEGADANTVAILAKGFPTLGKMEALLNEYSGAINAIRNHEETAQDMREGAYEELTESLNDARSKTARAKERSQEKLEELRHVPDETLATRAAILGSLLSKAADDPDALLNAYLRRAPENTADRRLLEQTAQALLDAGIRGAGFAKRWQRAQQRVEIPQAERDLIDKMARLEEIEDYLDSASQVMAADLQEHANWGLDVSASMNREYHRAAVHRFENGTRLEDMTPEQVGAAGVPSEGRGR